MRRQRRRSARSIEPLVDAAARREGYRAAAAAGAPGGDEHQGTLRRGQEHACGRCRSSSPAASASTGRDFALISPDIWRKQLLDYARLGAAYKYAGAFTGEELAIVDQKLDRYMARKAERGGMSHLLIDRFRFDSFAPDSDEAGSNLLTRFGQIVYLFFLVTPPDRWSSARGSAAATSAATRRSTTRSRTRSRRIPACRSSSSPGCARTDKRVHFEFLDNTRAARRARRARRLSAGTARSTCSTSAACSTSSATASSTSTRRRRRRLYPDRGVLAAERNAVFLQRCVAEFREVNFVEQATGLVYLRVVDGVPQWADPDLLARMTHSADVRAGLAAALPQAFASAVPVAHAAPLPDAEAAHTVGQWGRTLQDPPAP